MEIQSGKDLQTILALDDWKKTIGMIGFLHYPKISDMAVEITWDHDGKMFRLGNIEPHITYFWVWKYPNSEHEIAITFDHIPKIGELLVAKAIVYLSDYASDHPMFECSGCNKLTHWTKIKVDPLNIAHPLVVIKSLYQERNCGCGIIPYPDSQVRMKSFVSEDDYCELSDRAEYELKRFIELVQQRVDPEIIKSIESDIWYEESNVIDYFRERLIHNARGHKHELDQAKSHIRRLQRELEDLKKKVSK